MLLHSCSFVCFGQVYGLKIGVYNTLASRIHVKLLKPPKIQIPTPNTSLSDLRTHSWFHSMLFALPSYQFPYTVMNRCLYLTFLPTGIADFCIPDDYSIQFRSRMENLRIRRNLYPKVNRTASRWGSLSLYSAVLVKVSPLGISTYKMQPSTNV